MTAKRILLGALLWAGAGAASAQTPAVPAPGPGLMSPGTGVYSGQTPLGGTPAVGPGVMTDALTTPAGLPGAQPPPGQLGAYPGSLHQQILASPPNCCGPVGANGPTTYELYARTGPVLIVGGGNELSGAANFGWAVQGGSRALLFNEARDAAWALDLGLRYAYNGADQSRVFDLFVRPPLAPDPTDPNPIVSQRRQVRGPDLLLPVRMRGLTRADLTYAIGRDWFLNGPGLVGSGNTNTRFGVDVGGRYGTIRGDFIPVTDPDGYARKSVVSQAVTLGAHLDVEVPYGATILFGGVRTEYGYIFSNVAPPQDGNIQDVSILLTLGVRF